MGTLLVLWLRPVPAEMALFFTGPNIIETLHAYIHDRFFTPIDTHLRTAWDNGQPLFEKIWP